VDGGPREPREGCIPAHAIAVVRQATPCELARLFDHRLRRADVDPDDALEGARQRLIELGQVADAGLDRLSTTARTRLRRPDPSHADASHL
jgi:hypothetical protein